MQTLALVSSRDQALEITYTRNVYFPRESHLKGHVIPSLGGGEEGETRSKKKLVIDVWKTVIQPEIECARE